MILQVVVTLTLCGAVFSEGDSTQEPPRGVIAEMSHDWQEIDRGYGSEFFLTNIRDDWRESGLQFKVVDAGSGYRLISFYSDDWWYGNLEFGNSAFSFLGYNKQADQRRQGLDKQTCNATGGEEDGSYSLDYNSEINEGNGYWEDDMIGTWTIKLVDNKLSLWRNEELGLEMDISRCASWLLSPEISMIKLSPSFNSGFDKNGEGAVADQYRYAEKLPSAQDCLRGEFWWKDECYTCPPGKSTVRQGYTEYNDCIDIRYISCRPEEDAGDIECERNVCPCNSYEECNQDSESMEYGMCSQRSGYGNGGVNMAASAGLVVLAVIYTLAE